MRTRENMAVVTFFTTAEAMATERLCREQSIPGRLIPAPRKLSADCGLAWASAAEERERLESALRSAAVEYDRICELLL